MTHPETILIVDDDIDSSTSLERAISNTGYATRRADDGFLAIRIVKTESVDLVMLDVNLPGMNGILTLHEMKMIRPRLPVIMMTAHPTRQLMQEALEEGAASFVPKPLNLDYLRRVLQELLGL
jgi:two-component system response regulator (stage 0 sporulation protein F)